MVVRYETRIVVRFVWGGHLVTDNMVLMESGEVVNVTVNGRCLEREFRVVGIVLG